jgi:hypothetical protein
MTRAGEKFCSQVNLTKHFKPPFRAFSPAKKNPAEAGLEVCG